MKKKKAPTAHILPRRIKTTDIEWIKFDEYREVIKSFREAHPVAAWWMGTYHPEPISMEEFYKGLDELPKEEERMSTSTIEYLMNKKGKAEPRIKEPTLFEEPPTASDETFMKMFGFKPSFPILLETFMESYWDEKVRSFIPQQNPHYVFPKDTDLVVHGLQAGDNILITGLQGTGKTTLVEQICSRVGRPCIRMNGSRDLETSKFFGHVALDKGTMTWEDGLFTLAFRHGAVFLYDEGFSGPPEINIGLHPVMEPNGPLILADKPSSDKVVPRHEKFRMVLTDNTKGMGDSTGLYAGTSVQNVATLDRFGTYVHIEYPEPAAEKQILVNLGTVPAKAEKLVQLAKLLRTGFQQGQVGVPFSTRVLINLAEKERIYRDMKKAFDVSFKNRMPSESESMACDQIFKTVF